MESSGIRKGAWSEEEDFLLRRCIEDYGQAKWNLVPERAGLNRCRKSCRLRWLNYLQPSLNREEFKEDEIDLIIKMHKLLGNRWSLIAGRLSGRTANDVKNYWNSNLKKKVCSKSAESPHQARQEKHEVIKPKPTYFCSKVTYHNLESNMQKTQQKKNEQNQICITPRSEENNMWWNDIFPENPKDAIQNTSDANEQRLSEDDNYGGYNEAMDPKGATFDSSIFEWDALISMNDWLMN